MDRMRINAHEQAQEIREYKVGFEANGVKFSYTPSICETCADLIDELESSNAELFAKAALFDAAAEKAEEYKKQIPQWTPVENYQPAHEILAINKHDDVLIGYIDRLGGDEFICQSEHEVLHDVTHWTEVPKRKKEAK